MYRHWEKAQNFIDEWTTRLNLPYLEVRLFPGNDNYGMYYTANKSIIEMYPQVISDRVEFITGLLHELCHHWYYWRFNTDTWGSEERVMVLSTYLMREFYPSYYSAFIKEALQAVKDFNYAKKYRAHYQGYVRVLKKFGVIQNVKKCKV